MNSKSGTFDNDLKLITPEIYQNDSAKEKASQKDIFSQQETPLNSALKPPSLPTTTESWQTKFSLIPQKIFSNKLLIFLLSFCLPIIGSCDEGCSSNQCEPLIIYLPSQPTYKPKKKEEKRKPVGNITRSKDVELIGGKIVEGCACGKRDGLSGGANCPRSCCRNNPGCFMNPPQCWPQFKEPPKPPAIPERKMICIPIEMINYDPSNMS